MLRIRREQLKIKQKERVEKLFRNSDYNLTRKEMICKVGVILHLLINSFMNNVLKTGNDKSTPS